MTTGVVHRPPFSPSPKPRLQRVGEGHPVVIIDDASGQPAAIRALAAALAPFPPAQHHYPGVRRVIDERDGAAWDYVHALVKTVAPYIAGAFDCEAFDLVEASFSIVTTLPGALTPPQRAPHFDGTDPALIAMVHYLADVPGSGTAFFRHRATGIDQLTDANVDAYVDLARLEGMTTTGYVQKSDRFYDMLFRADARLDRLLIYRGSLLHSGIIPPDIPLDPDPLKGRLTANYFLKIKQ
jgi:hypothetical protein